MTLANNFFLFSFITLSLYLNTCLADSHVSETDNKILQTVINDYKSFYSGDRLLRMGIGFGIAALPANTSIDNDIQDWYQDDIRSSTTDDMSDVFKEFGERQFLLPITAVAAALKFAEPDSPIANWGAYSLRAYATGTPALLLMQRATGASRPGETVHQSDWRPFKDDNGVSGHGYVGAVPFLTIARMNEENKPVKYLALLASTFTAWSRINDNAHYFSQAALGWYLAYESVDAVFDADAKQKGLTIIPVVSPDTVGVSANIRW